MDSVEWTQNKMGLKVTTESKLQYVWLWLILGQIQHFREPLLLYTRVVELQTVMLNITSYKHEGDGKGVAKRNCHPTGKKLLNSVVSKII